MSLNLSLTREGAESLLMRLRSDDLARVERSAVRSGVQRHGGDERRIILVFSGAITPDGGPNVNDLVDPGGVRP